MEWKFAMYVQEQISKCLPGHYVHLTLIIWPGLTVRLNEKNVEDRIKKGSFQFKLVFHLLTKFQILLIMSKF